MLFYGVLKFTSLDTFQDKFPQAYLHACCIVLFRDSLFCIKQQVKHLQIHHACLLVCLVHFQCLGSVITGDINLLNMQWRIYCPFKSSFLTWILNFFYPFNRSDSSLVVRISMQKSISWSSVIICVLYVWHTYSFEIHHLY